MARNKRYGLWVAALLAAAPVALGQTASTGSGQAYPAKTVRLIVPFPPGGSTETLARLLSVKLSEIWGQQIIIDNRPGAGGIIGTELGAKAAPDGYTLLMGSGAPLTIVPGLYAKLPYDPIKDFAPIINVAAVPNVIALHPSVPALNVKELIALARARPDQLTFASNGFGLVAPAAVAPDLLKRIHTDALQVLNTPDMRSRIASLGATPIGNTPEQFRAQIRDDLAKWARIIKISGARAD